MSIIRSIVTAAATAGLVTAGGGIAHAGSAPVYYQFVAEHSGKCLDVLAGSTKVWAATHQWQCLDGVKSQQWELRKLNDGTYGIVARHSLHCLDSHINKVAARVRQGFCRTNITTNQRWWFRPSGKDVWEIVSKDSGNCLDVAWDDKANGARIVHSSCWGGDNQRWRLKTLPRDA